MNKHLILGLVTIAVTACTPMHELGTPYSKRLPNLGKPIGPYSTLRKLSLHLRGLTPTQQEYMELAKAIEAKAVDGFLHSTAENYLKSNEHVEKMAFRMEELLFLDPSDLPFYSTKDRSAAEISGYTNFNSLNYLVREVISRNQSWDQLLLAKKYHLSKSKARENNSRITDEDFFSNLKPVSSDPTKREISFDEDDPRVAGIITTGRFFSRYGTTALNKNRRRVAAIFRTFLCDDMKAAIPGGEKNDNRFLDLVFPETGGTQIFSMSATSKEKEDPHSSDKACMKCHYKLDPMGSTFRGSGLALSPFPSPGALSFTGARGEHVEIPARGLGDIAKAITERPEYVSCQVKHFWRWFIGEDRLMDSETEAELAQKFEELGRRPNDFIAYLVSRPEFNTSSDSNEFSGLVVEVKAVLKNCNGCHAEKGLDSFTEWPIGGSVDTHRNWLRKIRFHTLKDQNPKTKMPPPNSDWQLDSADIANLTRWFKAGAPDESGERQIND